MPTTEGLTQHQPTKFGLSKGIAYMLWATVWFTAMQTIIKELNHIHLFEIIFFRSVVTSFGCMLFLKAKSISLKGNKQGLLVLRAFTGILSMVMFFSTIQSIPFGAALSLKYLAPIFTAIFAVIILRERLRPIQWFLFAIAFLGVMMLKGFDGRIDNINLLLGLGGAVFGGLTYIFIRMIGHRDHPLVIINYFMLSATVLAAIGMIPFWVNPSPFEWVLLIGMGSLGFGAQIYMTRAFQEDLASKVAPMKYMEIVFSLIIGFFWFGENFAWMAWIGIALIFVAMILNVVSNRPKMKTSS